MTDAAITSSGPALHQAVDQLTAAAQSGYNVYQNRDLFQERALRDVTVGSNESALMLDPNNPILVREEMNAQKDYFRRLKFTYLEQGAKRHFLASITGEEPQRVEPGENEELEASNAQKKAELKAVKTDIENMRTEAVVLAEQNAKQHTEMTSQLSEAQALQKEIRGMELELARIKATYPPENRMTISQATDTLDAQTVELGQLMDDKEAVQAEADRTRGEVARIAKDVSWRRGVISATNPCQVQRLGRDREREEAKAKEVREGREAGDTKVDDICRWLSSSMSFYRSLLGIRFVQAATDNELHLEYDVPNGPVTLALAFDPLTKRLSDATMIGSDLDVAEAITVAIGNNDVPGLIADVLVRLRT
ncbi:hypothetical protein L202_00625 [Cryptococcus amylolentus CBS 6039]|uniref:Kinetochore protein Sos7 coiled-coil domain-containing protein n=1 Tax=Cryptococcus amylolentus CBS 6039 TaxID=1295533 RepID=A0A1E3IA56_9TREE|nr:hypothetical protein L202_00625 [Cryptococcus amylolentus CBS 6039]ODN84746.1 hypothetical protein L202_00625 [Cryptococcus amylolentus CBS 6039]